MKRFMNEYLFVSGIIFSSFGIFKITSDKPHVGLGFLIFGCTFMVCQFLKDIVLEIISSGVMKDIKNRSQFDDWARNNFTEKELKEIYKEKLHGMD